MEKKDIELIEQHRESDEILNRLYKEHLDYERRLDKIERRPFLSPTQDQERRDLQKKKLLGRDQIEKILLKYR